MHNTKHDSVKFEYQIFRINITFLDTEIYVKHSKLYAKIKRLSNTARHQIIIPEITQKKYSL